MTTMIQFPPQPDDRPLASRISAEVRSLMGRHDVSQIQLARWMDLNQTAISARLRGSTEWKVSEIERVAEGFAVHPSELMGGHAQNPRPVDPDGGLPIDAVRHQGFEPRTRWFGGKRSDQHEYDQLRIVDDVAA